MDRILASERYETIAIGKLNKTIHRGISVRQGFWYAARIVGGVFALLIYIGAVQIPDTPLSTAIPGFHWISPYWTWIESCFAYLSPALVLAMVLTSLAFDLSAGSQLKALEAAADEKDLPKNAYSTLLASLQRWPGTGANPETGGQQSE